MSQQSDLNQFISFKKFKDNIKLRVDYENRKKRVVILSYGLPLQGKSYLMNILAGAKDPDNGPFEVITK